MAIAPRSILVALMAGLLVVFFSPAALAHDRLVASSPAEDATVTSLEEIELEFSSSVRMPFVALRDAKDTQVKLSEPKPDGKYVRAEVPEPLASGKYVLAWRVVSSDGHPIQGEIPFKVKAEPSPEPATPTAAAEESAEPTETAEAPETPEPAADEPEVTEAVPASPAAAAESDGGIPGWIWVAVVVLALLGGGTWFASSRAKRPE